MNQKTVVLYIHGIQHSEFDPKQVNDFIQAVSKLLPKGVCVHHISDWGRVVADRQRQVYNIVAYRGNWLTRKIREYICTLGLDMWYWLQTRAGNAEGDWAKDVRKVIDEEIAKLDTTHYSGNKKPKLCLVAHSWGTVIALDYFIRHPERPGILVTMGSPAPIYGSSCFSDWGNPKLLGNVAKWVNIGVPSDPISNLMKDNPNPAWAGIVEDVDIPTWSILPMKAHASYWTHKKAIRKVAETISAFL